MSRRPTSAKLSARSMTRSMAARSRSSIASRCLMSMLLRRGGMGRGLLARVGDGDLVDLVVVGDPHVDPLVARRRQVLADVVGADRKLAVATVHQHGQLHSLGPAVVEEGVDSGA